MIVVMVLVCGVGLLPLKVPAFRQNQAFLSYLNCFSAGIFLGMALLHMLPESAEIFAEWSQKRFFEQNGEDSEEEHRVYPFAYLNFFFGYLIILLFDRVVMNAAIKHMGSQGKVVDITVAPTR